MKQLFTLLFCLCVFAAQGQQFSVNPAKPRGGDIVRLDIDLSKSKIKPSADLELVVLQLINGKAETVEAATLMEGRHFIGIFTLSPNALSAVAAIRKGESAWENNAGEGYFIPVFDANGNATAEGTAASAVLYREYGAVLGLNRNPAIAFGLLNQAFSTQPTLKRKYGITYANCLMAVKKGEEGKKEAVAVMSELEADPAATEDELLAVSRFFERNGDAERGKSIKDKVRARFPAGTLVKQEQRRAIQNEPDLLRAEQLLNTYAGQYPPQTDDEKQALNMLRFNLANKVADSGDWTKFRTMTAQLPEQERASIYNNLAWEMAEKGERLDEARSLASNASEWARKELEQPAGAKPALSTAKEWYESRKGNFAMFTDTYAYILNKLGDAASAARLQKEVVELTEGKSMEMNERYVTYLAAAGAPELRYALEGFILDGRATPKMKELFKKQWTAEDHSEAGLNAYLSKLETKARMARQEELRAQMLDETAPLFSLTNLDGKTVSLESLRGKVVVIDFWATWCGPCKASFPGMQLAVNQYKNDPNVVFLFVDSWEKGNEKAKNAASFISGKGYTFNVLMDIEDKVIGNYGVSGIPTKFIVDKDGKIRFKTIGFEGSDEGLAEELSLMIETLKG